LKHEQVVSDTELLLRKRLITTQRNFKIHGRILLQGFLALMELKT